MADTPQAAPTAADLQPCPFCGGPAYYTRSVNGNQMRYVGCSPCGICFKAQEVHCAPTETRLTKDIVAAWNRRAARWAEPTALESAQATPTAAEVFAALLPLAKMVRVVHELLGAGIHRPDCAGCAKDAALALAARWESKPTPPPCPKCGGSGGGTDPVLACPVCHGTGKVAAAPTAAIIVPRLEYEKELDAAGHSAHYRQAAAPAAEPIIHYAPYGPRADGTFDCGERACWEADNNRFKEQIMAMYEEAAALRAELVELSAWKAEQQQFLITAAAELFNEGFPGDGILGGIKWLRAKLAAAKKTEREAYAVIVETCLAWPPSRDAAAIAAAIRARG